MFCTILEERLPPSGYVDEFKPVMATVVDDSNSSSSGPEEGLLFEGKTTTFGSSQSRSPLKMNNNNGQNYGRNSNGNTNYRRESMRRTASSCPFPPAGEQPYCPNCYR